MTTGRVRLRIDGTVQGVGFRPYVYRLARDLDLTGFVCNDQQGVMLEIEGDSAAIECFEMRLAAETPPLARCDHIRREMLAPLNGNGSCEATFAIAESSRARVHGSALVSPDAATCDDCLRELADPTDRRYRYPFVNCTNCGPRFSIVRGVPYDRPLTTMSGFAMCRECQAEYGDPGNRRFHAQPNACAVCGPTARFVDRNGAAIEAIEAIEAIGAAEAIAAGGRGGAQGAVDCSAEFDGPRDALRQAASALHAGQIVAVKGVGGYHIACLADDERAVQRLRERKRRPDKPFAIMVPDLATAHRFVELDAVEEAILVSRERPILLARRRVGVGIGLDGGETSNATSPGSASDPSARAIARSVAPGQRDLGVMLPYSPLHHVLLADVGAPLVLTSGNVSDEPIAHRDSDAFARLGDIVDAFLVHDRPIETPTDDSIVRVVSVAGRRAMTVRRSRGYVPAPLTLPVAARRPLLACGAHLKNTYGLAVGDRAWIGPHVGDLGCYETFQAFSTGIAHYERLFGVIPASIVHDWHPDYLSTKYAMDRGDGENAPETRGVQHHHAHLAACLAEHGEVGPAIGVIFDGTGLGGSDADSARAAGDLWGGEVLVGDLTSFRRAAHLWPVRMPGGEAAIREPWRMACSWLTALSCDDLPEPLRNLSGIVPDGAWRATASLARSGVASPWTTSAGRLFDALSALCGVRTHVSYEGQAAIEFEAIADQTERGRYDVPLLVDSDTDDGIVIDTRRLVAAVVREVETGISPSIIAARAHNGMAYAAAQTCRMIAGSTGIATVVLSGGVFQNSLLVERTATELIKIGLRVLVPQRLPCNDGGIAYGQLAIGAASLTL